MSSSGSLIREARLRAGLSQVELGERTGKDRAQIARWERDAVSPPFETLRMLLRSCGYDLYDDLREYDASAGPSVEAYLPLTPSERLVKLREDREAAP